MFKIFLFTLFAFLQFSYGYAASLHMMIVGDTTSNLTSQSLKDVEFMKGRGKALADALKIPCTFSIFMGKQATSKNVLAHIDSNPFDASDIVIFYFTGHGFRTEETFSKWPNLLFSYDNQYIPLDEVVNRLYRINTQFSLVIADCCNNYMDRKPYPVNPTLFNFSRSGHHSFHPKVVDLFKRSRGLLVISGAEPGGYSWANDEGGILTAAFFDALGFRSGASTVNWDNVLKYVHTNTWHIQKVQMAHYMHR